MSSEMVFATEFELLTTTDCEFNEKGTKEIIPSVVARELVEVCYEWVCSRCGCEFYNPGCVLTGLTLHEIMHHVKKMREQAFAKHVCLSHSEK